MRKREVASSYAYRDALAPQGSDRREQKLPREGDAPARSVGARGNPNNREQPKKPRRLYKHKRRVTEYWLFEKSGTKSVPPKCPFLISSVSYPKNRVIFAVPKIFFRKKMLFFMKQSFVRVFVRFFAERRKKFCRKNLAFVLARKKARFRSRFFRVAFRFSLRENRREFLRFALLFFLQKFE